MRADARRNRERLLDVARDVFVARGSDASLEEIARRSGLGIATLYRRFGDRDALDTALSYGFCIVRWHLTAPAPISPAH